MTPLEAVALVASLILACLSVAGIADMPDDLGAGE